MSRFLVLRKPCTMEDEGRETYIGSRETYEEAVTLREASRHWYYYPDDFEIAETK